MKTKHTEGDFKIEGNEIIAGSTLIGELYNDVDFSKNPKREGIDRLPTKEEAEANAKLFKAAPELLEALQMLLKECYEEHKTGVLSAKAFATSKASEAIKKATE